MRLALLLPVVLLGACHREPHADAVRAAYDNKADTIEAQGDRQPTGTAQKIYQARADAIRQEGKDRETGLKGGEPATGPQGSS